MQPNYNLSFVEELKKLNPTQKEAVDTIEGPVLVIAGPGTGKTQILSARIGKILMETDTRPHSILCLTYTDAGTIAMRKRLLKFIGPEAYRVNVFTFHAFCNQIIQENNEVFGIRGLQPISDLERAELFEKLIDGFGPQHPLKRFTGDVYYEINRLKSLFSVMKKEGWSAEQIAKNVDEYIEELPTREEFIYVKANSKTGVKKGDLKTAKIKEETEKMHKLKAAAFEFDVFESMLRKKSRYDYDDMIIWVLDAFRANPSLLANYQERFQYILVDEYQDTNGAQNQIVHLLASYWENPNVFVVGDDDQSIYRFQGANLSNILDFNIKYQEHLKIVILKDNYRSTQNILDASKSLIEFNQERLIKKLPGLDKNLTAKNSELAQSTIMPEVTEYYNILHEELALVNKLIALKEQGEQLNEIAVLFRNHKQVANIVKLLQKNSIPLTIKRKVNILELPLIQNLITLLTYIKEEIRQPDSGHHQLFELLHFDFFQITPYDANKIARACRGRKVEDPNAPEEEIIERGKAWRVLMQDSSALAALGLESIQSIVTLEGNLSYWIKESVNLTLQGLFEKILTRGGLLTWIMNQPDRISLMQIITTFFDFIKEESARQPGYKLPNLLSTLDSMNHHKLALEINHSVVAENGIQFITAHSSKGLEFDHVFLIGCSSKQWEKKSAQNSNYSMPDTLVESIPENKLEEERRLFYVAMTRAKKYLHISYAASDEKSKPQEASQFIAEVMETKSVKKEFISLSDESIINYQADLLLNLNIPEIKLMDEEFMKDALKNYKLSVTHLNKYLSCPIRFYFENIIQVPSSRSESMGFGSAVHFAMEELFKKMSSSYEKEFPPVDFFIASFQKGLRYHHSHFTEKEFERKVEYGNEFLPLLYNTYKDKWNKHTLIEYAVKGAEVEGVPLSGKLDKIEIEKGNIVNVIDYKTGKFDNGKKKLVPPNPKDPDGGDYWRQIVFYKILLDSDQRNKYEMVSGELDFVEPDKNKEFHKEKVVVDATSVGIVKKQIKDTYTKIMNFEFSKGCGEEDCQWCNFVKYNYKGEDLQLTREEEEEETTSL